MHKVKVLHCADLHLGSGLSSITEKSKDRQQELLRTFRKITSLCLEENVDVLLIAGDFLEGSNVDQNTITFVKEHLGNLKDTIVAISPGNHDYVSLDSPYQDDNWPENVVIFKGSFRTEVFADQELAIHGFGFESTYVREEKIIPVIPEYQHLINLCVVHGDLVSGFTSSSYHPISERSLKNSGMDYVAMGHIHKRTPILKAGNTHYAYAGCADGRGFDELGVKGVYLLTVSKEKVDSSFIPLSSRQFLEEAVDLTGKTTTTSAEDLITNQLKEKHGKGYANHYYKLILTGNLPEDHSIFFETLKTDLKDTLYYVKLRDETSLDINLEALAEESSMKGIFVKRMLEKIEDAKTKTSHKNQILVLEKALDYGLKAFEGRMNIYVD